MAPFVSLGHPVFVSGEDGQKEEGSGRNEVLFYPLDLPLEPSLAWEQKMEIKQQIGTNESVFY